MVMMSQSRGGAPSIRGEPWVCGWSRPWSASCWPGRCWPMLLTTESNFVGTPESQRAIPTDEAAAGP